MEKIGITQIIHGDHFDKVRVVRHEGINSQQIDGRDQWYAYNDSTVKLGIAIKYGYYIESFTVKSPAIGYAKEIIGTTHGSKKGLYYDKEREYVKFYSFNMINEPIIVDIKVSKMKFENHKISLDIPGESDSTWEILDHPDKIVPPGEQVTLRIKLDGKKFSFISLHENESSRIITTSSNIHYRSTTTGTETGFVDILFIMPCDHVRGMASIYKESNMKKILFNEELSKIIKFHTGIDADRFDTIMSKPDAVVSFDIDTEKVYQLHIYTNGYEIKYTTEKISDTVDRFTFTMPNGDVSVVFEPKIEGDIEPLIEKHEVQKETVHQIKKEVTRGNGDIIVDWTKKPYIPLNDESIYGENILFHSIPAPGYTINSSDIKVTTIDNRVIHIDNNIIRKGDDVEMSTEFIMPPSDVLIQAEFTKKKENSEMNEVNENARETKNIYINDEGPGTTVVDSHYNARIYDVAKPRDIVQFRIFPYEKPNYEKYSVELVEVFTFESRNTVKSFVEASLIDPDTNKWSFRMPDEAVIIHVRYVDPESYGNVENDSDIIDWFEIPDELAKSLSEDLTKMSIRQRMLDDFILDAAKYEAAEKLLVPIVQSVEAKKVLITRQYVPEIYRSEAYQWNYDGYEIDGNKVQILKAGGK